MTAMTPDDPSHRSAGQFTRRGYARTGQPLARFVHRIAEERLALTLYPPEKGQP